MNQVLSLEYLAGLFDGEGSFSIQVNVRQRKGRDWVNITPRASMKLKYGNEVLEHFVKNFGGRVYDASAPETKQWVLGGIEALIYCAESLQPHLVIKKRICMRFLEALHTWPKRNPARNKGSWTAKDVRRIGSIALTLNPASARKQINGIGHLESLVASYEIDV